MWIEDLTAKGLSLQIFIPPRAVFRAGGHRSSLRNRLQEENIGLREEVVKASMFEESMGTPPGFWHDLPIVEATRRPACRKGTSIEIAN